MTDSSVGVPWRSVGFWCAMIMGLAQASSAARAFADPQAFSVYMGLPIDGPNDAGFVTVYALRTTLIAALAFFLALTGRLGALAVIAFVALLLPIGDAWLSAQAGAPQSVVYRHIAIAVFLAFTAFMLRRDANRVSDK